MRAAFKYKTKVWSLTSSSIRSANAKPFSSDIVSAVQCRVCTPFSLRSCPERLHACSHGPVGSGLLPCNLESPSGCWPWLGAPGLCPPGPPKPKISRARLLPSLSLTWPRAHCTGSCPARGLVVSHGHRCLLLGLLIPHPACRLHVLQGDGMPTAGSLSWRYPMTSCPSPRASTSALT